MSVYYEEHGNKEGPSIVFIHGGSLGGWIWKMQLGAFNDYHCIIPDLPGHGKSDGQFTIKEAAEELVKLIQLRANNKKAIIVGHSVGGRIAAELLAIRPDCVEKAVICSALFKSILLLKLLYSPALYRFPIAMLRLKLSKFILTNQMKFPIKEMKQKYYELLDAGGYLTLPKVNQEMVKTLYIPEVLKHVHVPVLAMAGELESKTVKASVGQLISTIPDSTGVLLNKCMHQYPWSEYVVFNDVVLKWLSENLGEGSNYKIINGKAVPKS